MEILEGPTYNTAVDHVADGPAVDTTSIPEPLTDPGPEVPTVICAQNINLVCFDLETTGGGILN